MRTVQHYTELKIYHTNLVTYDWWLVSLFKPVCCLIVNKVNIGTLDKGERKDNIKGHL